MGVSAAMVKATKQMPEPIEIEGTLYEVVHKHHFDDTFEITSFTRLKDGKVMKLQMMVDGDKALEECGPADPNLAFAALRYGALQLKRRVDYEKAKVEGRDPFEERYADPLIDAAKAKQAQEAADANQAALEELPQFGMF